MTSDVAFDPAASVRAVAGKELVGVFFLSRPRLLRPSAVPFSTGWLFQMEPQITADETNSTFLGPFPVSGLASFQVRFPTINK
jgi:hypothetical protein